MITIDILLLIAALACIVLNAMGRFNVPLWVAVLLMWVIEALRLLPVK